MKIGVVLAALAGLLGAAYLIFYVGFDAVFGAALSVGWGGFALLWLYGAANFVMLGLGWMLLVPPYSWRSAVTFCWGRAVRDSAGDVLPFSQIGGMVIGARAVILRGVKRATSFGSTIVEVSDNGSGIPKDVHDKVFKGFFSTKGTEGTGLGLLVVQKVIDEHGGTVSFESEEGRGTRFTAEFPATPVADTPEELN